MNRGIYLVHLILLAFLTFLMTGCTSEEKKVEVVTAGAFRLPGIDSVDHRLSDYEAEVIMVHFWADWCSHCRREFRDLQEVYDRYRDQGFQIVSINSEQTLDHARQIRDEFQVEFPMLADTAGTVSEEYGITGLPTSLFLDRSYRIRERVVGWIRKDRIEEAIRLIRSGS